MLSRRPVARLGPLLNIVRTEVTRPRPKQVCIVGAGPSGFYVADSLLAGERGRDINISFLERYPTPFGLVRFGVAPDHPEVKVVEKKFEYILRDKRVSFYGGMQLGRDVQLDELRKEYHAVVLAYGAYGDRKLGVPGESLPGVFSAREFVGWYNGDPEFASPKFDLSHETVAIVGQGNVAVDVARILLAPPDALHPTDIMAHAVDALRGSRVRKVVLVGRRGVAQASCTTAELRELVSLPGVRVTVPAAELATSAAEDAWLAKARGPRRVVELLRKTVKAREGDTSRPKELQFRFLRSPVRFEGTDKLTALALAKNRLEGVGNAAKAVQDNSEPAEQLLCGLAFRSIGYQAAPVPGVPLDPATRTVPTDKGRVLGGGRAVPGLYASGWLRRGPVGVIANSLADAREVAASVTADFDSWPEPSLDPAQRLGARTRFTDWHGWRQIDREELKKGAALGKVRAKAGTFEEMEAHQRTEGVDVSGLPKGTDHSTYKS